ncbi:MAG: proton-conducting transporter membrane subunit [Ignavibacteriaceae bacterium]|nr:proton-conducting transporter membrane subunit [Ignavibacteriaceae bacterium]
MQSFLFIGATGKSAQIPLLVWLPDANGWSRLLYQHSLHAATMVTAGVYMVARCRYHLCIQLQRQ